MKHASEFFNLSKMKQKKILDKVNKQSSKDMKYLTSLLPKVDKLAKPRQSCVQCGNQLQVVKNILSFRCNY